MQVIPLTFLKSIAHPDPSKTTDLGDWKSKAIRVNDSELWGSILKEGMRDPFIISAGRLSRTIRLEAGNHRVNTLLARNIKYAPAVVLVTDEGIKCPENGSHRQPCELLIPPGDPLFGPYDEHIYMKISDVIPGFEAAPLLDEFLEEKGMPDALQHFAS